MTKREPGKTRYAIAAVAVIIGAALGGLAVAEVSSASIPDAAGVLTGCYKASGASYPLKLIDPALHGSCPKGYTQVTWKQTGQAGPPGSTGVSHGYSGVQGEENLTPLAFTQIESLAIPAGSYIVNARVQSSDITPSILTCELISTDGGTPTIVDSSEVSYSGVFTSLSLLGSATLSSGGSLSISCRNNGDSAIFLSKITAVAVNQIN